MSASRHLLIRLASIAVTATIVVALRPNGSVFLPLVLSFGLAHYVLSLRYSLPRVAALVRSPAPLGAAVLLAGAGTLLYVLPVSLVAYFGVHHALNEGYAGRKLRPAPHGAERLFAHAAVLHGALYAAVLREDFSAFVSSTNLLVLFAAAYASFAVRLARVANGNPRQLAGDFVFELVSPLALVVSFVWPITFLDVVLYHYAFWTLFPMFTRSRSAKWTLEYAGTTVAVIVAFLAVSPLGFVGTGGAAVFTSQFLFWSYFHITTSFALSDLHPEWIVRRFAAVPARA